MKTRKRKRDGTAPRRCMQISLTMPTVQDLSRGMEIAANFEENHGGKPYMFFSIHGHNNVICITVLTPKDNRSLKRLVSKFGAHTVKLGERGPCRWEHYHAYQVAKHCQDKTPAEVMEVFHWIHNMIGYSHSQEARNYTALSSVYMSHIQRPNEPVPQAV